MPEGKAIVFELKADKQLSFESQIKKAEKQICDMRYVEGALADGARHVDAYAVAFAGKRCMASKYISNNVKVK
jgi:hypothetical protein